MASRRRQPAGRNGAYRGYSTKGYNAKQKMMNIHFRYSDVVKDYAEALLQVDGRLSLIMDDCSQAELHNLDKIEFDALMARLNAKERASVLGIPVVGLNSVGSMTSVPGDTVTDAPSSSVPAKTPLVSPRPDGGALQAGSGSQVNSLGSISANLDEVGSSGKASVSPGDGQHSGTENNRMATTGNPLVVSSKSVPSVGLSTPSRQQKGRNARS